MIRSLKIYIYSFFVDPYLEIKKIHLKYITTTKVHTYLTVPLWLFLSIVKQQSGIHVMRNWFVRIVPISLTSV